MVGRPHASRDEMFIKFHLQYWFPCKRSARNHWHRILASGRSGIGAACANWKIGDGRLLNKCFFCIGLINCNYQGLKNLGEQVVLTGVHGERGSISLSGGLGVVPPVGFWGKAPGGGSGGFAPEADDMSFWNSRHNFVLLIQLQWITLTVILVLQKSTLYKAEETGTADNSDVQIYAPQYIINITKNRWVSRFCWRLLDVLGMCFFLA